MYTLNVVNKSIWAIDATVAAGAVNIQPKIGTHTFDNMGSLVLKVEGIGDMSFMDLGNTKLPGYPNITETWGVLVRFHATEAYYRYEGGGILNADFDEFGTCNLSTGNGTLVPITLEELVVNASGL